MNKEIEAKVTCHFCDGQRFVVDGYLMSSFSAEERDIYNEKFNRNFISCIISCQLCKGKGKISIEKYEKTRKMPSHCTCGRPLDGLQNICLICNFVESMVKNGEWSRCSCGNIIKEKKQFYCKWCKLNLEAREMSKKIPIYCFCGKKLNSVGMCDDCKPSPRRY